MLARLGSPAGVAAATGAAARGVATRVSTTAKNRVRMARRLPRAGLDSARGAGSAHQGIRPRREVEPTTGSAGIAAAEVTANLRSAHAGKARAAGATRVDRRLPSLRAPLLPTHRLGSHLRLAGRPKVRDDLRLSVPLGLPKRRGLLAGDEQRVPLFGDRRSAAGKLRAFREAVGPPPDTQPLAIASSPSRARMESIVSASSGRLSSR